MKRFKSLLLALSMALSLSIINLQPVRAYTDDSDGPQDTVQKKAPPIQGISPQMIAMILGAAIRVI